MSIRKSITSLTAAALLTITMSTVALATETIPVIDNTKDFSKVGTPIYVYEGDFVIQSHEATAEEIQLGKDLQELHTHPDEKLKHLSNIPHSHSIRNVKTGTSRKYKWNPSETWVKNDKFPNEVTWPQVSWSKSQDKTESASFNTSVGVDGKVVSATLGGDYSKSHTISTTRTITFHVPYRTKGRVEVSYSRPYKTFTCVTKYIITSGSTVTQREETGAGSALGRPSNVTVNLATKGF